MKNSPAPFIDHSLLSPVVTPEEIRQLCEEAVEFGFAAVCIPPSHVPLAARELYGSGVRVATVVGFPLGYETTSAKVWMAREAVERGAGEIDLVINQGLVRAGELAAVEEELQQVVTAVPGTPCKVIIECCRLGEEQKRWLTEAVVRSGAAFVKTSTGFAEAGATEADVRFLAEVAAGRIGVKAAGGIRDWSLCRCLLEAGASRIGTSAGVAIMREWLQAEGLE